MTKFGQPVLLSSDFNAEGSFKKTPKADALPDCATRRLCRKHLKLLVKADAESPLFGTSNSAHKRNKMQANEWGYCDKIWTVIGHHLFESPSRLIGRARQLKQV